MGMALQPLLLGPLVGIGLLDNTMLGWVAFAETFAVACVSLAGPALLGRGSSRTTLASVALVLVVLNSLSCFTATALELLLVRTLCGAAEGILVSGAVIVLLASRSPDRANAAFIAGTTIICGTISYFIPTMLIPAYGARSVFGVLAVACVAAIIAALLLRYQAKRVEEQAADRQRWPISAHLVLIGLVCQNCAMGAAWAFLERVGAIGHFTPQELGLSASLSLAGQVVGPVTVAVIAHRLPGARALAIASLVQAGTLLVLGAPQSAGEYIGASALVGLLWMGSFPFSLKLALQVENQGRAAAYCVSAQMFGLAFGPALAAELVTSESVYIAYETGAALLVVAAVLYGLAGTIHRTAARGQAGTGAGESA